MTAAIDGLISPTLKNLRERWWDDEFTEFLAETLRPRPGNRILDVGCGTGLAEVNLGRLHISQVRLFGVDVVMDKVLVARRETAAHNQRAVFAGGDARRLPFRDGAFDSVYCVAVLQHLSDVSAAVIELARVTVPGGTILAVEPDNHARYFYSSTPEGGQAFDASRRFFAVIERAREGAGQQAVGPTLPGLFERNAIEPVSVRVFPVSHTRLATPNDVVWEARRRGADTAIERAPTEEARAAGRDYLAALAAYEGAARAVGASFVEIQSTLLFATVGRRAE